MTPCRQLASIYKTTKALTTFAIHTIYTRIQQELIAHTHPATRLHGDH